MRQRCQTTLAEYGGRGHKAGRGEEVKIGSLHMLCMTREPIMHDICFTEEIRNAGPGVEM
jgi:hypothetical protein